MTDHSAEPRDPWAPPERPAGEYGGPQGGPAVPGPPSVHDQITIAGMPGAGAGTPPAPMAGGYPGAAQPPAPAQPAPAAVPPAYAYPAQPAPGGYAYPAPPPAPSAYGYPGYPGHVSYVPYGGQPRNGFGTTALVLGILSVVGCITSFLAVAIGIGAVVFGALGRGKARRGEATNGGMALAGIILGAIGILLGAAILAIGIAGILERDGGGGGYDSPYSNSRMREKV
ncbi:DUF4190 domain-containing protein [Streptomyces sp. NPDC127106]|uniref:DUF4190 domain-containing protein n=1 Tax=Streptomyces sp. NPDC127106 TaxID=3345360 RepID=UPI00363DC29B